MSRSMVRKPKALPSRFPVGTKFVIEARPAAAGEVQVFKRFIEFPDGTLVRLPPRPDKRRAVALHRARAKVNDQSPPPGR